MAYLFACALLALAAAAPPPENHARLNRRPPMPVRRRFEDFNPAVTDDGRELFEADMVLTEEQKRASADGRQAETNLWTSPVSFAISFTSEPDRTAILAGIQHWRDNTCVQFNEVAEGSSFPHIKFIKGNGCWSLVGKAPFEGQDLSIGDGCTSLGTVVHEIGHAMGLRHQQSRHDRDNYVTIMTENIQDGKQSQFEKKSTPNNYSVPYDLTSIMHYGSKVFSKNDKDTIRVNNFLHQHLIGREGGMSHRDKQIANAMYNCASSCTSPPTCQNGGFVGKNCACVCPPNTSGTNCETLTGTYYPAIDCGNVDITQAGTITTPNYPNNYPTNKMCWWVIKAPTGQRVKVTFTDFDMLPGDDTDDGYCEWDFVALRYKGDAYIDDKTACGRELKGTSFTSTGNQFIIKLKSEAFNMHKGFSANVEFVA